VLGAAYASFYEELGQDVRSCIKDVRVSSCVKSAVASSQQAVSEPPCHFLSLPLRATARSEYARGKDRV